MTALPTRPLHYSQVDVDAVFEPVQPLLLRMMLNHASPDKIVEVLDLVAAELRDRHQQRLAAIKEYQDRARIAAENRPTLHHILTDPKKKDQT